LAHTVLVASPNKQHYHEFVKRERCAMFCMPVWKWEELATVREYMDPKIEEDKLRERYNIFGGIPRYVFAGSTIYERQMTEALHAITFETIMQAIQPGGSIDAEGRVPSVLFYYESKEPFNINDINLKPASEYVAKELAFKFWERIMKQLNPLSHVYATSSAALGNFFEALVCKYIIPFGGTFETRNLTSNAKKKESLTLQKVEYKQVLGWKEFVIQRAQLPLSTQNRTKVLHPAATNQSGIDMMDAKDRVYQVTVSHLHGLNADQMSKLVQELGASKDHPLKVYFVVPFHIFADFEEQTLKCDREKFSSNKAKLNEEQLRECVEQYALCIPEELSRIDFSKKDEKLMML
jgi:hypothetical protein